MAQVLLRSIEKSFGETRVLKGIDLAIEDGEFVSLVGPSGCGKSTLLRIIAGLEHQDAGSVTIGSRAVDGVRASDRNLSMVFQSYALYPHLTVAENIAVPLRMRELDMWQRLPLLGRFLPGTGARLRHIGVAVDDAARMLDITHLMDRRPGQLSGGQRQRVALGRALVRRPDAFLLDEPLSNLDAKLRVHTRAEIAELHRRLGATFIYVTHDQAEAMTMSDRIAVMMDGALLQVATPDEIYNNPADIRVAGFIGSPQMNLLPVRQDHDGTVVVQTARLPLHVSTPQPGLTLGVRPEAVRVAGHGGALQGFVRHIENLGSELFVQVGDTGAADRIVARLEPAEGRHLCVGMPVGLGFDPARTILFGEDGRRVPAEAMT
ncbi:ABC transporter ATP-binding protein, partial [Ferrovibrio sp.]|uniref:ABC transporter ATP-binding protein n=1 Tax=Ferrovibrio sp. TaxID=1917215 RepID=UPI00311F8396